MIDMVYHEYDLDLTSMYISLTWWHHRAWNCRLGTPTFSNNSKLLDNDMITRAIFFTLKLEYSDLKNQNVDFFLPYKAQNFDLKNPKFWQILTRKCLLAKHRGVSFFLQFLSVVMTNEPLLDSFFDKSTNIAELMTQWPFIWPFFYHNLFFFT